MTMAHRTFTRTWLNILVFLMTLHSTLVLYSNSSYLDQLVPQGAIGIIYATGAIISFFAALSFNGLARTFGTYRVSVASAILGLGSLLAMAADTEPYVVIVGFTLFQIAIVMLYLSFDIFLEHVTKNSSTGATRGVFLTVINSAYLIGPLIGGAIIDNAGFAASYLVSFIVLALTLFGLLFKVRGFKNTFHRPLSAFAAIRRIRKSANIRGIIGVYFCLYIFYAFMMVYMPLYLAQVAGYSFSTIGVLLAIIFLPFVLFQIGIGKLADKRYGEKEFIVSGLCLMAFTTLIAPSVIGAGFAATVLVLLLGRTGAAAVEICSDSYFFKQVDDTETELISAYRSMMYAAMVIVPLFATALITLIGWPGLFAGIALITFLGVIPAMSVTDSR